MSHRVDGVYIVHARDMYVVHAPDSYAVHCTTESSEGLDIYVVHARDVYVVYVHEYTSYTLHAHCSRTTGMS